MEKVKNRADVAVFVDFENIYVSVREKFDAQPNFEMIMDRCEDYGRIVIARAYADWYRYPRVTSALFANGVEPMYVPTYYYDREAGRTGRPIKNSVDIHLCIDAMRTLYTQTHIDKFVLVTGDRDFIPLVNAIRQHGKEVIIIGIGGAASAHLAQSSDEFLFYEQIADLKSPQQQRAEQRPERSERRDRERDRDKVERTDGNGKVDGRREKQEKAEKAPEPVAEPVAEPVEASAPERNFYDTLVDAINLARQRGFVSNLGSLKVLMRELDSNFHESKVKDRNGKPFTKFKDFVKEAERQSRVQIFTNGTVTEVFLPGEDPLKVSQFAEDLASDQAERELELELDQQQDQVAARAEADAQRAQPPAAPAETVETGAAETPAPAAEETAAEEGEPSEDVTFSDRELDIFRGSMMQFGDPVRFADIFTMLRGLRNQEVIDLTNNELKELVKQAINRGMLQRTGRGARAYYRLSSQYRVAPEETHDQRASRVADSREEQPAAEQVAPIVESAAGTVSADGLAPSQRQRVRAYDLAAEEAAPVDEAAAAVEINEIVAEQVDAQTVDAAPAKPRRNRRRKSSSAAKDQPQAAEEAAPAVEVPEAASEASVEAAAEPAEAGEAKPNGAKKRRSRRKKAAPAEETQTDTDDAG